jgi:hypothetical protein
MLAKLIRPEHSRIGTYTAILLLCLCEGMQENGILHTIDIKELVDFQRKHFDKSPWEAQITTPSSGYYTNTRCKI